MSYDLYFWNEVEPRESSPEQTLEQLSADQDVEGITVFQRAQIVRKFTEEFPDITDDGVGMDWEGSGSYFRISFTHLDKDRVNCIIVTCGYKLLESPEILNRIIDTGHHFGCALYDPQTSERYGQP